MIKILFEQRPELKRETLEIAHEMRAHGVVGITQVEPTERLQAPRIESTNARDMKSENTSRAA